EGRNKWSVDGFALPDYEIKAFANFLEISTACLKVIVHQPLYLEWQYKADNEWKTFASDRKTGAYLFGISNTNVTHYLNRHLNEQYYGLGEKTGNLNRHGRRFE
ncbi:alpha-glucosidase, partial [Mannheimia haemolytica]